MTLVPALHQQHGNNARLRVNRWPLPLHSETEPHAYDSDHVIVPVTDGTLMILTDEGATITAPLAAGVSYFRKAGVSLNETNCGNAAILFLEVEVEQQG